MRSKENVKLPPIVNSNDKVGGKPDETERSSESESNSSSTSTKRFKSFKQLVNIVGKNSKWTKEANEEVQEDQSKKIATGEKRLTFNASGKYPLLQLFSWKWELVSVAIKSIEMSIILSDHHLLHS